MKLGQTSALRSVGTHLKEIAGFGGPSIESFRVELARLGLLGRAFGPSDYARALEQQLRVRIVVEEFPDSRLALARRSVLKEGTLAEVFYEEERGEALILVRESLRYRPWPAYDLALYHELSHLAACHPTKLQDRAERGRGIKMLRVLPFVSRFAYRASAARRSVIDLEELREKVYEPEAKRRARWLVLAGTYPEFFEREGANRLA